MNHESILDARFIGAVEMLRRTGQSSLRIGHTIDEEDGAPTIWHVTGVWSDDRFEAAAGRDPLVALLRLCELVIDGGQCTHCGKTTIFTSDIDSPPWMTSISCVYSWDPELKTFRRMCEDGI